MSIKNQLFYSIFILFLYQPMIEFSVSVSKHKLVISNSSLLNIVVRKSNINMRFILLFIDSILQTSLCSCNLSSPIFVQNHSEYLAFRKNFLDALLCSKIIINLYHDWHIVFKINICYLL